MEEEEEGFTMEDVLAIVDQYLSSKKKLPEILKIVGEYYLPLWHTDLGQAAIAASQFAQCWMVVDAMTDPRTILRSMFIDSRKEGYKSFLNKFEGLSCPDIVTMREGRFVIIKSVYTMITAQAAMVDAKLRKEEEEEENKRLEEEVSSIPEENKTIENV